MQAFGRREYIFSDDPTRVKPFSAIWVQIYTIVSFDIKLLGKKVIRTTQLLSTADFILHHIHTFTIHVAALILLKAALCTKNSRLVSDKLELGFRYPCDGPGIGITISDAYLSNNYSVIVSYSGIYSWLYTVGFNNVFQIYNFVTIH